MEHDELVSVEGLPDRLEAGLALSVLEAAGIKAIIQADDAGGQRPHIAFTTGGYRIMVRPDDAELAREVLTQPAKPVE